MANIIRHLHRLTGGGGAGSPTTVAPSGVISINFDTGSTPALYASNGTAWQLLNPTGAYATSAQIITGTLTGTGIDPAGLAGASVVVSGGVADAGKYVRTDANGLVDDTVVPKATGATVVTGTATDTFITPATLAAAGATTGALANAGKYVRFDATGYLDNTIFDFATSAELLANTGAGTVNGIVNDDVLAKSSTVTSAGAADQGKFVRLDATGKIDTSVLNLDVMEYKGGLNATSVPPSATKGDLYVVTTGGAINAGFGVSATTAGVGDQFIYNGTGWDYVQSASVDLSGYLPLAGTAGVTGSAMASGAVITMNPTASGNTVFDADNGAIDNALIDCGNF